MDTGGAVGSLFIMTMVVAVAVGVFMLYRARRSQLKRGEQPGTEKLGERQR